ncbi:hypothetical protein DRF75_05070 [Ehrlichia minasensis]|uniref:Uncharacterized protein n=1 Tax=Ehrlichia minasensis TaxID=1242993 RepID=A0A4V2BQK1_9RICK|nr:hypothetical protein DRF75_05070 [Ehrlichia minasensis]CEI85029.1 Uncharacterized protein ehr_00410 [Ehrlichia minasensis]
MHVNVRHGIVLLVVFTFIVLCLLLYCLLKHFFVLKQDEQLLERQKRALDEQTSQVIGEEDTIKPTVRTKKVSKPNVRKKIYEPLDFTSKMLRATKKLGKCEDGVNFNFLWARSRPRFEDIPFLKCLMFRAYTAQIFHDMLVDVAQTCSKNLKEIALCRECFAAFFYDTQWLAASILGNPELLNSEKILQFIKTGRDVLIQRARDLEELLLKVYDGESDIAMLNQYRAKILNLMQFCEAQEKVSSQIGSIQCSALCLLRQS